MKKITKILIGTHNKGKYKEISQLLSKKIKKVSPSYFKSCGSEPIEVKGKKVFSLLIFVLPKIDTWDINLLFFPISTLSPITQYGPIEELLCILAFFDIIDEG